MTTAALGPHALTVETLFRVARAMTLPQVRALAAAAARDEDLTAQRAAASTADPARTAALHAVARAAHEDIFPGLRRVLTDEEGRLARHADRPAVTAAGAAAAAAGLGALVSATAAASGATSWALTLALALCAALTFLSGASSIVWRMWREDRALALEGQVAWGALLDAATAVTVADLCETRPGWTVTAYGALTRAWSSSVLPLPDHPDAFPASA